MHHNDQVGVFFFLMMGAAAIHSLLPTHWLSFVLVGRAQKWPRPRMLKVLLASGLGHVTTTSAVGLFAAFLGKNLQRHFDLVGMILPGTILVGFGLFYVALGWRRRRRRSGHPHHEDSVRTHRVAAGGLILEMSLEPCEALIPIFFAAGALSWPVLILMAAAMSAVTLGAMAVLAWIGYAGYRKLTFPWLVHNERLVLGSLLMAVGGAAFLFH
jgi:nickel/cobalt transporter (NicO) family protein